MKTSSTARPQSRAADRPRIPSQRRATRPASARRCEEVICTILRRLGAMSFQGGARSMFPGSHAGRVRAATLKVLSDRGWKRLVGLLALALAARAAAAQNPQVDLVVDA